MESSKNCEGKPMSTSVPTFRFHVGGDELEQIYPEIEEETSEKEMLRTDENCPETSNLSAAPPVAPPRSPKHNRSPKHSGALPVGEMSPVRGSQSTGSLNKRSTSIDTGITEAPGSNSSSGWGLFTDIRGKIVRTVEEIKSDRLARSEATKLNLSSSQKDNTSFSDSEEASSSESNQVPSTTLSTSDSVSQLSSLSTTPTTPSTMPLTQQTSSSGKWHTKLLSDRHDDEKSKSSRPVTPSKGQEEKSATKSNRAGSVPSVHESTSASNHKRCSSLRSRLKPKLADLRNRRKRAYVDSRSNSSLSSVVYSADGDETDEDLVESGVEALEESWEETYDTLLPPSTPLGDTIEQYDPMLVPSMSSQLWTHRYILLMSLLFGTHFLAIFPTWIMYMLMGALAVLALQSEKTFLLSPTPSVAEMHMGNQPFIIPDYSKLPMQQIPAAKEILSTDSFQGWMNELSGPYDTKTYHISMTESVHVHLEGSCLSISHTRSKVSKRAMWNETPIRKVQSTDERLFDLRGWQVKLLPEGITRRRQWSKKYPICLVRKEFVDTLVNEEIHGNLKKDEREAHTLLTSAKYAKSSTSTDSLDMLLFGAETPTKDHSYSEKKTDKAKMESDSTESNPSHLSLPDKPGIHVNGSEGKLGDTVDSEVSDIDDDDSFCMVSSDMASQNCIFLFARADREKEEWYRRFAEAVRESEVSSAPASPLKQISNSGFDPSQQLTPEQAISTMSEYLRYMQRFHLEHIVYPPRKSQKVVDTGDIKERDIDREKEKDKEKEKERDKDKEKGKEKEKEKERDKEKEKDKERDREKEQWDAMVAAQTEKAAVIGMPMSWLNAIIGRICFDVLRSPLWKDRIHQRLQKKLSTLKLPYFMEALTITELDLGNTTPIIHRSSQPSLDVRGLWVELDITYQGNFRMTIESKVNLMRLKRNAPEEVPVVPTNSSSSSILASQECNNPASLGAGVNVSRSPVFDSDLDDTAESSSDDDHSSVNTEDGSLRPSASTTGKRAGKKLLRMVDKIAASKYFQQATEMKYIKRAMEGVSNTRIMLSVELKGLVGTLALNIPPPPSDRLWYGFHGNPKLWLSARPTLGERQVNFYHISNWIEQKLCQEFQKVLVLPNMDDIVIPVMTPQLPV